MIFLKRRALMTRASFNYKTVSGIGSAVLENCVETKFKKLVLSGNSKQTTTKGSQLLDKAKMSTPQAEVAYYNMQVEEGKYTLSTKYRREVQKDLFLLAGEVNTGASSNVNGVDSTISRTVESINGYITIGYRNDENGVNPFDFETMLNKGDIPLPYESYTGGKPSPSPEYQQEIKNVGKWNEETQKYEVDVKVTGKNLIDVDELRNENGYLKSLFTNSIKIKPFKVESGKKYLLVAKGKPLKTGVYSSMYLGEDNLKYMGLNTYVLTTGTGVAMFSENKEFKKILIARKTTTITRIIIHGQNVIKDAYDVEELGLFEMLDDDWQSVIYEPYKEPQTVKIQLDEPLRGIGEYKDVVTKDWIKRKIGHLERKGGLAWNDFGNQFRIIIRVEKGTIVFSKYLCNYTNDVKNHNDQHYIYLYFTKEQIEAIGINTNDTLEVANKKLNEIVANKPIVIEYPLKTPIFEPFPPEIQTKLSSLYTNEGTTVVTIDGGEVQPDIEVEYAVKE